MKEFNVPQGETKEIVNQRKEIILDFYREWKSENPEHRVFNRNLRDYIYVKHISISETAMHASKRFLSTLAVLQLDGILSGAKKVSQEKVKQNSNQNKFRAMIIMNYLCPGIGLVKLTVGVEHKTFIKTQYCITAIEME